MKLTLHILYWPTVFSGFTIASLSGYGDLANGYGDGDDFGDGAGDNIGSIFYGHGNGNEFSEDNGNGSDTEGNGRGDGNWS